MKIQKLSVMSVLLTTGLSIAGMGFNSVSVSAAPIDEKLSITVSKDSIFLTEEEKQSLKESEELGRKIVESLHTEEELIATMEQRSLEIGLKEREEKRMVIEKERERVRFIESMGGNPDFRGTLPERALSEAMTQVGKPYLWGAEGVEDYDGDGDTRDGYDCSGILVWSYARQGKTDLPRTTGGQWRRGQAVSKRNIQKGDLIYFLMNREKSPVDHVGIYIGDGKMLHAPRPGDVVKVASVTWSRVVSIRRHME